jgi:small ligand-binding sensory domain FIST
MAAYGAAISQHPDPAAAVGDVVGSVLEQVGQQPDTAVLFTTAEHTDSIHEIVESVRTLLAPTVLIGATAQAVIGGTLEAEEGPAISLWAGRLGAVEAVRLETISAPEGTAVVGMPDVAAHGPRTLLLLTEPRTFPASALMHAANRQYPDLQIVGGVASCSVRNHVILNDLVHDDGAVGVLLPGGLGERVVVSQGCRPVGEPLIVTAAVSNRITELGSRPATERLSETVDAANDAERELLSRGLHIGLVVDEHASEFGRGDFLIRGVLGADHSSGSIRVGASTPVGSTVQFQIRDAAAANEDLREMLAFADADAALMFTCNGRGSRLFGAPDHDATLVAAAVNNGPVAGMFCAGEFGPIRGENHIHGFTASMLLLYG